MQYYSAINESRNVQKFHGGIFSDSENVPIFPGFAEISNIPSANYFKDRFIAYCDSFRSFWDFCCVKFFVDGTLFFCKGSIDLKTSNLFLRIEIIASYIKK